MVAGDADSGGPRLGGIVVIVPCLSEIERDEANVRNRANDFVFAAIMPPIKNLPVDGSQMGQVDYPAEFWT